MSQLPREPLKYHSSQELFVLFEVSENFGISYQDHNGKPDTKCQGDAFDDTVLVFSIILICEEYIINLCSYQQFCPYTYKCAAFSRKTWQKYFSFYTVVIKILFILRSSQKGASNEQLWKNLTFQMKKNELKGSFKKKKRTNGQKEFSAPLR